MHNMKNIINTAAAAAKSLQSCPTLYDPIDGSLPGSSVLGFSRQECRSGFPFPSPMHESEKWREVPQSCLTLHDPMDWSLPGSSIHGSFQARVLEWTAIAFSIINTTATTTTTTTTKSLQSCPTLYDPIDGSLPGSSVPGILQARTLEWVATSFSNAWKWKVKVKSLNCVRLLVTPWTAAYQSPPPMGFSRQEQHYCMSYMKVVNSKSWVLLTKNFFLILYLYKMIFTKLIVIIISWCM